jgi:molecular chaperone GrpE
MIDDTEENNDEFVADEESQHDDVELSDEEGNLTKKLKDLKAKLKTTEMEKAINLDGWQRERADFLNFKRRASDEKIREKETSTAKHLEKLLPFCDSFELALKSITENTAIDTNTKNGLRGIGTQLNGLIDEYGVSKISPPIGSHFDPNMHEALSTIEVDNEKESNTIREIIQSGYSVNGTVILSLIHI